MAPPPTDLAPVPRSPAVPRSPGVPPLSDGDSLLRPEFERRYHAMPHVNKAELIEGRVYMPSPVKVTTHGEPHALIVGLLLFYRSQTPGTSVVDNGSVRLDLRNMPQPDVLLRYLESHGGQSRLSPDGYLEGAPEFIAEIAGTSASVDLFDKLDVYRRCGVKEYLVWTTHEPELRLHRLAEGNYQLVPPDEAGVLRSEVFPGLWFDPAALLANDAAAALATLQRGLAGRVP